MAIKAGNPNAVSQWNSWTLPRLHDFQEHYIGEHILTRIHVLATTS